MTPVALTPVDRASFWVGFCNHLVPFGSVASFLADTAGQLRMLRNLTTLVAEKKVSR